MLFDTINIPLYAAPHTKTSLRSQIRSLVFKNLVL